MARNTETTQATATATHTGEQLGGYVLGRRIAVGGMGEVYLAELERPGGFRKTVVVKRILPRLANDPKYVEMFFREGRIAGRLSHTNIVQVFELGEQDGAYFLAMEYVEGLSLAQLARRAWAARVPLPLDTVTSAIADAAMGLSFAHALKDEHGAPLHVLHRDVTPDNLMITRDGVTKILDFGIARPRDRENLTAVGELKGKLPFMAPEYLREQGYDHRVDLYGLGVTLYFLATGALPRKNESSHAAFAASLAQPPPALRTLNPAVPERLEKVALACLDADPQKRPRDGAEIAEELLAVVQVDRERIGAFVRYAMTLPQPAPKLGVVAPGALAMSGVSPAPIQMSAETTVIVAPEGATSPTHIIEADGQTAELGPGGGTVALTVNPKRTRQRVVAIAAAITVLMIFVVALAARVGRTPTEKPEEELAVVADASALSPALTRRAPTDSPGAGPVGPSSAGAAQAKQPASSTTKADPNAAAARPKPASKSPATAPAKAKVEAPPKKAVAAAAPAGVRRARAQRVSDGAAWMSADGELLLDSKSLSWTPTSFASSARPLSLAMKDIVKATGEGEQLTLLTSWGATYVLKVPSASGWARDIREAPRR